MDQAARQRELLSRWLNQETFCQHIKIRDKRGEIVPAVPTPAQRKNNLAWEEQELAGKPVRVVALKARQVHSSAGICAKHFKLLSFLPNLQALAVADLQKTSERLWKYYDQYDQTYTGPWRKALRVAQKMGESITWDNGSRVEFDSAESSIARGGSFRHAHFSEYSHYGKKTSVIEDAMGAIPKEPETSIIVESTANGRGGAFYDLCQTAMKRESGWRFVFFGWWEHPEYSIAIPTSLMPEFQASLSQEEIHLQQKHNLTLEQLSWRRFTIETDMQGSVDKFRQEFPSNPEEAFLTSGRPRFNSASIHLMPTRRDALTGSLQWIDRGVERSLRFVPAANGAGALTIFKPPQKNATYVIGADSASGKDVGELAGKQSDPDRSAAPVLDQATGEQVAIFCARVDPGEYGRVLAMLGRYYNWAFLVPELNNTGYGVLNALFNENYPRHLIYRRVTGPDTGAATPTDRFGFLTNDNARRSGTRSMIISDLDVALNNGEVIVYDPDTITELLSFVWHPDGREAAALGQHDDRVFGLALAQHGRIHAPRVRAQIQLAQTGDPDDQDTDRPRVTMPRPVRLNMRA